MKYFVKTWMFYMVSIWIIKELIPAFVVKGGWISILTAGGILAILMLFIKPIIKILFIPINFLTLGVISWFVNVIVIYLLTLVAPNVAITPWQFSGISWQGFIIPILIPLSFHKSFSNFWAPDIDNNSPITYCNFIYALQII